MSIDFIKKNSLKLALAFVIAIAAIAVTTAFSISKTGADDKPPLIVEVERHGEVLDNHEDRLTNSERDITELQDNTGTAPATDREVVREVVTQSPSEPIYTPPTEPEPEPEKHPRQVVRTNTRPSNSYNIPKVCKYTTENRNEYLFEVFKDDPCPYKLHDIIPSDIEPTSTGTGNGDITVNVSE